jgi:hypothetical protein
MIIKTKREFYELARLGKCGNTLRTWGSVDEYRNDPNKSEYGCFRSLIPSNSFRNPVIHCEDLSYSFPVNCNNYIISEVPGPDDGRIIQGELTWANGSWWLFCTFNERPMREALEKNGKHFYGANVIWNIRHHFSQNEYDDLTHLFYEYSEPGNYPTVEFSLMRKPMGRYNSRLIIWEVRNY